VNVLLLTIAVILIAFFSSLTGIGGGILYLPLFVFFGFNIWEAASLSIFLTFVTALVTSAFFFKHVHVTLKTIYLLELFSFLGAFIGGLYCVYLDLYTLFIIYIAYSLSTLILYKIILVYLKSSTKHFLQELTEASIINMILGILYGLTAVAGSSIRIPQYFKRYQIPYRTAIATSSLSMLIVSLGALSGRLFHLTFDIKLAVFCTMLILSPAALGATLALKVTRKLIINATYLFYNIIVLTNFILVIKLISMHLDH